MPRHDIILRYELSPLSRCAAAAAAADADTLPLAPAASFAAMPRAARHYASFAATRFHYSLRLIRHYRLLPYAISPLFSLSIDGCRRRHYLPLSPRRQLPLFTPPRHFAPLRSMPLMMLPCPC